MKKPEAKKKGAAQGNGNITVDLGEAIDRKLRSVMGKGDPSDKKVAMAGPYRPGMFGWRPHGADRPSRFGGSLSRWTLGDSGPLGLKREVSVMGTLTGIGVGIVGNRAIMRVSPAIVKTDNAIAHTGIAFVVGLIPVFVKQNAVTLGVAIPGAVYFAGSIVDWAFDAVGISKPALRGGSQGQGINQAIQARQRLQDLHGKIQQPRMVAR